MGIKFNPLTGLFDLVGSGSAGAVIGGPVGGSVGNSILTTDGNGDLTEKVLNDGELLIGVTGGEPIPAPLTGTINQVTVSGGPGSITLSLPQNIDQTANPTFSTINLTDPSNQLNLGTGVTGLIVNSGTGAALRTYSFPDVGPTADVVMTEGDQSINGVKSFNDSILATDIDALTPGGTLNFGATAAGPMTFGNSSSVINFNGTVYNNNVTNLNVTDKLITINDGGGAVSGFDSGLEIEEDGVITGYAKTSMDRNSFLIKAPGTLGVATITPGPAGITIDQDSHNPVTLGAVGGTPNAFAATLTNQVLNLEPANDTNPGVVTAGIQSFGGAKTFQGDLSVVGTTTLAAALSGPVRATAGVISTGNIDAATEITGILPIANGGTGTASAPADGTLLIGSATGYSVSTLSAGAGISIINNPGSITVASLITQYTDEMVRDVVANALTDSSSIDFTYDDVLDTITADLIPSAVNINTLGGILTAAKGGTGNNTVPTAGEILVGRSTNDFVSTSLVVGPGLAVTPGEGTLALSLTGGSNNDAKFTSIVDAGALNNTIPLATSLGGVIYLSVVNTVNSLRSLYKIQLTQDFGTSYTHTVDITGPNQTLTFSVSGAEVFQIFNQGSEQVTCTGRFIAVV